MHLLEDGRTLQRPVKFDALRRRQQFDPDNDCRIVRHLAQPARCERRHADVVFLVGGRGQAVDTGGMGHRLVFRGQRGCRHVRDHDAGVQAWFAHQERRQAGQMRVDQQRDAALGQRADFGNCQRQRVGRERHRLGMEIPARDDLPTFFREH
jgi:hypothetical protein